MTWENTTPGRLMAAESAQSMSVFARATTQKVDGSALGTPRAIYTVARGSSDAAANILTYEFMRELGIPVTSLPPSVFSLGAGAALNDTAVLVISQSGASDDLVLSARGAKRDGASVVAIINQPDSPVEKEARVTLSVCAGPELAVPATKSVIGSIGAGMALLSALKPEYGVKANAAAKTLKDLSVQHLRAGALQSAFLRARHIYVIGRDTGFGTAQEVALKLKECCALHAEAYSSSEVLHGPLQLATNPLMVLMLDTGMAEIQDSLDQAEARFNAVDCDVHRIRISEFCNDEIAPAAAAAVLLAAMYPVILNTALALGLDPDAPETLSKVTQTT
jgi:glucosamine--fructose-6-phosphate aminotransferase (isomerizing)